MNEIGDQQKENRMNLAKMEDMEEEMKGLTLTREKYRLQNEYIMDEMKK